MTIFKQLSATVLVLKHIFDAEWEEKRRGEKAKTTGWHFYKSQSPIFSTYKYMHTDLFLTECDFMINTVLSSVFVF